MKKALSTAAWLLQIIIGCMMLGLGFNLFLMPHQFNGGGLTGLAQIIVKLTGFGSVGIWVVLMNLPLFAIAGFKIGKKFFWGSLVGMLSVSASVELFTLLPVPDTEPLLAVVYGGVLIGLGLGIVFMTGASTGGSDIIVRLLKRKWQNVPIGTITMGFDLFIMLLTGLAFGDMSAALYTGLTVFLAGKVIDMVVYSFDNSKVAMIISSKHEKIADMILHDLNRGMTYLKGEGAYSGQDCKVILTAIKKHQLAELKRLVSEIDPNAFVIVQEAHQVLGDGFSHYSKDSL